MPRTKARIAQLNVAFKDAVRAATTGNIADLAAGAPLVVDGVTVVAGNRILAWKQTTGSQNGIYRVVTPGAGSDGAWVRDQDFDEATDAISGIMVLAVAGSTYAKEIFALTNAEPITVGTTALVFELVTSIDEFNISDYVVREVPTGAINGTNVTFTLAFTPEPGTEHVYLNGVLQHVGASNDYTISGVTITMNDAPKASPGNPDVILVSYWKNQP